MEMESGLIHADTADEVTTHGEQVLERSENIEEEAEYAEEFVLTVCLMLSIGLVGIFLYSYKSYSAWLDSKKLIGRAYERAKAAHLQNQGERDTGGVVSTPIAN